MVAAWRQAGSRTCRFGAAGLSCLIAFASPAVAQVAVEPIAPGQPQSLPVPNIRVVPGRPAPVALNAAPVAVTDPRAEMRAPRPSDAVVFADVVRPQRFVAQPVARIDAAFDALSGRPPLAELRRPGNPQAEGLRSAVAMIPEQAAPAPRPRNPLLDVPAGPDARLNAMDRPVPGLVVPVPRERPGHFASANTFGADVPLPRARPRLAGLGPATLPGASPPEPVPETAERSPPVDGWPRLLPRPASLSLPGRDMASNTCRNVFALGFVAARVHPPIEGPGGCGARDVVELEAVTTRDGRRIEFQPAATLNCAMGEAIARWVRDELDGAVRSTAGGKLVKIHNAADYQCRTMNWMRGNRMSEHGRANALDIRALTLEDGRALTVRGGLPGGLAARWRETTCQRFATVLGPGSDGFHEDHIHVDLMARNSETRICRWRL
jgi:hypothetical protein